jgi:hypothetical protein
MKLRSKGRFLTVLALALCLVVFNATLAASPSFSRTSDSDQIREAVFRYQIQHDIDVDKPIHNPVGASLRFLAVNEKDSFHKSGDRFSQNHGGSTWRNLRINVIRHLSASYPQVKNYSQMAVSVLRYRKRHGTDVEKGMGIFFWTERLHWINHASVEIAAGSKNNIGGWSDYGGYVIDNYHVVKHGHTWVVKSVTRINAAG